MNLITDRQASDLSLLDTLRKKIIARTATEAEWAQWNADLKAAYNASDLNRVIAAVEYLVDRLTSLGYQVDYTPIQFVRDVTLEPDSVVSGDEYDTYTYTAPGNGTYICSVPSGQEETISVSGGTIEVDLRMRQLVNYTMLYDYGDECVEVTGGWTADGYTWNASYGAFLSGTKNSDHFAFTSRATKVCGFGTNNSVSVDSYKSIHAFCVYTGTSTTETCNLDLGTQKNYFGPSSNRVATTNSKTMTCISADISSLSGEMYVVVENNSANSSGRFYSVFLTKPDNYTTLAAKAGISATSISDVLAASETLLSNKDAVEYMVKQCTGDFMASAIQSDAFLTALDSSPYKTLVQGNEHWAKFLAMVA